MCVLGHTWTTMAGSGPGGCTRAHALLSPHTTEAVGCAASATPESLKPLSKSTESVRAPSSSTVTVAVFHDEQGPAAQLTAKAAGAVDLTSYSSSYAACSFQRPVRLTAAAADAVAARSSASDTRDAAIARRPIMSPRSPDNTGRCLSFPTSEPAVRRCLAVEPVSDVSVERAQGLH